MGVKRLKVEVVNPKINSLESVKVPPISSAPNKEPIKKVSLPAKEPKEKIKIETLAGIMNVVAKILAIRLFLFLSIIGSFVLAIIADVNQTLQSLAVVVLFAGVTTLPLTILEWRNRNGR